MRNTLPLLARPVTNTTTATATPPQPAGAHIPTIRLISATPSAVGMSSDGSASFASSWASVPSPLAPRPEAEAPRKRLVPKKSKLSMLGVGSKDKDRAKARDFSDVVRRVGGSSTARGGFEIYVDPTEDPDMGEIVMVKKKKSRAALDGMRWGALGEVTNVPAVTKEKEKEQTLKVKVDEKDKWWSIGRGRKDSKEKGKDKENAKTREKSKTRAKSPEPVASQESRQRFNSLDSGILLNSNPVPPVENAKKSSTPADFIEGQGTFARSATPTAGGLLAPPNSIAVRAMRSVRSLARIGSWAQLRNTGPDEPAIPVPTLEKEKSDDKADKKEKPDPKAEKKKKKTTKKKEKAQTVRLSTSSFEAGALTASPAGGQTLGKKKHSILGLGLPSTMRLPTVRGGSTASSVGEAIPPSNNRLSVESAAILQRPSSTFSSGSSLRPMSTSSAESRVSSGSSAASVRWDEERLESVKERRKKERASKQESEDGSETAKARKKGTKAESRHSLEGRRRTPLSAVFPDAEGDGDEGHNEGQNFPVLTLEEATSDGHSVADNEVPLETPVKRARPRPLSEQLLKRSRPRGVYEPDGDAMISILDAATNDLAQLINHLDLEATPGTPDLTPLKHSPFSLEKLSAAKSLAADESPTKKKTAMDSPLRNTLRASTVSISSLRPYAQSRGKTVPALTGTTADLIGQQIAPWPTLNKPLSPLKESPMPKSTPPAAPAFRLTHKRTMTPSPAPEPSPVFHALRPAKSRQPMAAAPLASAESPQMEYGRALSSITFGSRASSRTGSRGSLEDTERDGSPIPAPVFKKVHVRKPSSLVPEEQKEPHHTTSMPIAPDAKRGLGLAGTMGASIASGYEAPPLDADDPDSDIPDELQVILSGNSDGEDTCSYHSPSTPPSPGALPDVPLPAIDSSMPPRLDLPVFRAQLIDDDDNHADLDGGETPSDDDTNKSFDFTGELQKLNESGGSDRRSFVEQLENAFRTPAKIDLKYGFGDGFLQVDVPAVPRLPELLAPKANEGSRDSLSFDSYSGSRLIDIQEQTFIIGSEDSAEGEDEDDVMPEQSPRFLRSPSSMGSRPSDGQLNTNFKFGGRPKAPEPILESQEMKLTLSDIIPPPSHVRSLSMSFMLEEDNSVLKSIYAKAAEIPEVAPRPRVDSDSSSKRRARDNSHNSSSMHSRASSGISFVGFESFDEVRRGFEFNNSRPAFYPPPGATRRNHGRQESLFSIASVSSYGRVINPGSSDPFDYGLPSLRERPSSEDMSVSMSMTVDDTFSLLGRGARRRVESDASSFYFQAPSQSMQPYSRGHRRHESGMSIASQAPPISMFNRSFGAHRRNDSSTSVSSVAQSYAMYGASGGRAAWARHRQDPSMDSIMSDFSVMRLGRPGVGDKMFDTAADHGMPLTSISASPPESAVSQRFGNRSSFDSILDDRRSSMDDSLFDKTGHRTSMSSDSVFGYDESHPPQGHLLPPNQYRPVSVLSRNSVHSPVKEDDTMITMFDGDHVRRRSIGSIMEASPCVRVEKRKHTNIQASYPYEDYRDNYDSPNKARIVEKPSIASTSSYQFGGERMIKAQRGLLERQSLEDSCLVANGEDLSSLITMPVFSRPGPASRSRSSTCTSSSSGADTPPLSASDGSSQSEGSQSSIDLSRISIILANATHPTTARARARARARGHGHRRRLSQARASRSSVYETIEEELSSATNSPASAHPASSKKSSPTVSQPVFIVEPDSRRSSLSESIWDDERGIVALRQYYALRDEAQVTVSESKRTWVDTPFSMFALQSFNPPQNPEAMKALLEHSVQNYGPLPSELRPRRVRSRTQSRASPYPHARVSKTPPVPAMDAAQVLASDPLLSFASFNPPALQTIPVNPNIAPQAAAFDSTKPFATDIEPKRENAFGLAPGARPRVPSNARRSALGWSKRSTGKSSTDQKENVGQGLVMTPGESLRLSRPRPRGRPTPAAQRPIRV